MIQCIVKKSTNEFITAAIRFGRHLIDAGDNFFFDANRKNFVSIIPNSSLSFSFSHFFAALSNWHNRQIAFVMNASRAEFATIL